LVGGNFFDKMMVRFLQPLAWCCYGEDRSNPFVWQHSFLVKYEIGKELRQHTHVDNSDLTVNICLGREGFTGGGLFFYGMREEGTNPPPTWPTAEEPAWWTYEHQVGKGIFHPGKQYHGAEELTGGERCNLIIWCRQADKYTDKYMLDWSSLMRGWRDEGDLLAMLNRWLDMIEGLGERGGEMLNSRDKEGRTLLHFFVILGHEPGVELILQKCGEGAAPHHQRIDFNAMDNSGWTALHYAAMADNTTIATMLLEQGRVQVNAQSGTSKGTRLVQIVTKGQTPLHIACSQKPPAVRIAKLLIEKGADVMITDEKGEVPNIAVFTGI
jgi:hypothetical protein